MRKIAIWILAGTLAAGGVQAQDAATQQQIDKLSGQLQDIIDTEAAQSKRLDALAQEISELRDKVNTPVINNSASAEDLQKLATQVREIDGKRQDDKDLILRKIEEVAKIAAAAPVAVPSHPHHAVPEAEPKLPADDTSPAADSTHYEYIVKEGQTLSAIIKAYNEKGVKVTRSQVMKANPGLKPNNVYAGQKIIIPIPEDTTK